MAPEAAPPLPTPPFIAVPGIANFRDIGGYLVPNSPSSSSSSTTPKVIRCGIFFRSADPSKVTPEGAAVLRQLGVTTVYDLRSGLEIAGQGGDPQALLAAGPAMGDAERVFTPVFLDTDYSPAALAVRFKDYTEGREGFVRAYASILSQATDPAHPYAPYTRILKHLASPSNAPPTPILVHCTAGKDRTGVIAALVLALCGLDDEAVAHEYGLTDLGLRERREELVAHVSRALGLGDDGIDRAKAENMVGSHKENMVKTLEMIREKYGSVEKFVIEHCRLTPEEVDRIRQNMVVDLEDGQKPVDWRAYAPLLA